MATVLAWVNSHFLAQLNIHRMQTASTMLSFSSLVLCPFLKVLGYKSSLTGSVKITCKLFRDGRLGLFLLATARWGWTGIKRYETENSLKDVQHNPWVEGLATAGCHLKYQAKCNIQVPKKQPQNGPRRNKFTYQDWEVEEKCWR